MKTQRHKETKAQRGAIKASFIAPLCAFVSLCLCVCLTAQAPPYDLILRNGKIIDGTGSSWYRGDVAIRGDTIVRIAQSITESAARVIDVGGQAISPGFIDIHSHAREGIFEVPAAENYIRQGVTTVIEGPDGKPVGGELLVTLRLASDIHWGSVSASDRI